LLLLGLLLLLLLFEQELLKLHLVVKEALIGNSLEIQTLTAQIIEQDAMLLTLTLMDPARNANMRA